MLQSNVTYLYDGSFNGFLSAIYEVFERKEFDVLIERESAYQSSFFDVILTVETNGNKAKRVWKGLEKLLNRDDLNKIYYAFLSENSFVIQAIFKTIQNIFKNKNSSIMKNFGN